MAAGTILFMLGGVLGRIAGPIAQNWYENHTRHGEQMRKDAEDKKKRECEIERAHKAIVRETEYEYFLKEQSVKFQEKIRLAEEQLLISQQTWNQKEFFEKCFPLRNPYDMPLGLVLKETDEPQYTLKTIKVHNGQEIAPLRVISAFTTSSDSAAKTTINTINNQLSSFIVNNYPANSVNCIFSEIGAWKENIPVNDASINYLFDGLKGQPVLVLAPIFENGRNKLSLKAYMWGIGENVQYPNALDCGWIDLELITKQIACKHIKKYVELNQKVGESIELEIKPLYDLVLTIDDHRGILSDDELNNLIRQVTTPEPLNTRVISEVNETISQYLQCFVGMYSDAYHLTEYGTIPKMPTILSKLDKIEALMPAVSSFYQSLIVCALEKNMITANAACNLEYEIASWIKNSPSAKVEFIDMVTGANALFLEMIDKKMLTDEQFQELKDKGKPLRDSQRLLQ